MRHQGSPNLSLDVPTIISTSPPPPPSIATTPSIRMSTIAASGRTESLDDSQVLSGVRRRR